MAKKKKQSKLQSFRLDTAILDELETFCAETGITKTAVIERGITHYIDVYRAVMSKAFADAKVQQIADAYTRPANLTKGDGTDGN